MCFGMTIINNSLSGWDDDISLCHKGLGNTVKTKSELNLFTSTFSAIGSRNFK